MYIKCNAAIWGEIFVVICMDYLSRKLYVFLFIWCSHLVHLFNVLKIVISKGKLDAFQAVIVFVLIYMLCFVIGELFAYFVCLPECRHLEWTFRFVMNSFAVGSNPMDLKPQKFHDTETKSWEKEKQISCLRTI